MSDHLLDDDDGAERPRPNGNGHEAVSDEDLRELLAQERRARATAEQQRAEERTNRTRAERERDEARGHATTAVEERWKAEEESLDAGLAAAESEADGLEARIAQLNADGAFAEAAKASRQLSRAEAQIGLITQKKAWLTDAREMQKQQAKAQPRPQNRSGQDVSVDLSTYSQRQRDWIERDHPEYLTDGMFRSRVAAAHYAAVADGIEIDSDDYYSAIEERLEKSPRQRREAETGEEAPRTPRRDSNGALAVQRRAPGGQARPGEVRLSPDQREAADFTMSDVPIEDYNVGGIVKPGRYKRYAQLQARLRQEGRLN